MTLLPNNNHHANLVVSKDRKSNSQKLWDELSSLSISNKFFDQTVLDIETAREIIAWANTPYNDEKIALISFNTAGLEAQNALLKIIEEPPQKVKFIFVVSNKDHLIDTFKSRLNEIRVVIDSGENLNNEALIFLQTEHSERMKLPFVIKLLSQKDEEDRKDREGVKDFILSLVLVEKENGVKPKYILETIEIASYVSLPSTSGKALVEYLSLLLPVVLLQSKS